MSSSLGGRRDLGRFHVMRKCERRADPRDRIFRGERERGRVQNPPVNQQDPTPTPSARKYAHVCVPLTPFYALLPTNVAINMHLHEARDRKLHAAISAMERENDTWCEATTRLRKPPLSSRPHLVLNSPVIEKKETDISEERDGFNKRKMRSLKGSERGRGREIPGSDERKNYEWIYGEL